MGSLSEPNKKTDTDTSMHAAILTEDHFWFYWQKYKMPVIACIIAALLGLLGMEGYELFKTARLRQVQAAYLGAMLNDDLSLFATAYPHNPLSGAALIQTATKHETKSDFADAADAFRKAQIALKDHPLLGRAYIGEAFSLARAEKTAQAAKLFEAIAANTALLPSYRAEAAYQRALLAAQADNATLAAEWIKQVEELPHSGLWARKAEMLKLALPTIQEF